MLAFADAVQEAGFPPGVVNIVSGSGAAAGEALVASPHVDMVSFTGSTGVGRSIGAVAGRDMKRLLLELGGKGAALVFDDADVRTAVGAISSVWAFHSGQICTRAHPGDRPARPLRPGGRRAHRRRPAGSRWATRWRPTPWSGRSSRPPTATGSSRTWRSAARRAPPSSLVASARALDRGFYVAPTLIADAKPGMRVVQEEIFGPVVVVLPFDDEDEGIALANGTDFGLNDYVFSGDTARACGRPAACGPAAWR